MRTMQLRQVASLGFLTVLLAMAGCGKPTGGTDPSLPKAEAAALPGDAASQPAQPKGAGTAKTVESPAQGAAGVPAAPAKPAPSTPAAKLSLPAAPAELAYSYQLVKMLDLSTLPAPEGATEGEPSPTRRSIGVPLSVPAAVAFYLGKLEALGWKRAGPEAGDSIAEEYAHVTLGKDGYRVALSAMPEKPKNATVVLSHLGALDSRTLPRIDGAVDQFSNPTSSLYFASAQVAEAADSLRRLLKADGWQEYCQAFSQTAQRPDAADMMFRKRAYSLMVTVSKPADQSGKVAVQYIVATLAREAPAPADAKRVELDDGNWVLQCDVPRDIEATAAYYRKAMEEAGLPPRPNDTAVDNSRVLSFESASHDLVLITLTPADPGTTKVKLEGHTAAFRERMNKAAAAAKEEQKARAAAEAKARAEQSKKFQEEMKQDDDAINAMLGTALKELAKPPAKPNLPKNIPSDVDAQIKKALDGVMGADPKASPEKKR